MIVIDITANNIHMLCAHQTKDTIVVDGFAQLPLPARLSEDGLEDIPALADALRAAFAQYNFKERDATILLSGATVISHELEVPYENKPAAMMNILAGELSDVLGRDDHVFDYAIMDTYEKQQTAYCRRYAYLVKRKLVADAQTLLREAGKRPR